MPAGTLHLPEGIFRVSMFHTNDHQGLFIGKRTHEGRDKEQNKSSNNMWKRAMKKLEFSQERKPTREGKLHLCKSSG